MTNLVQCDNNARLKEGKKMTEDINLDPTAFGLFMVAAIMLPLAVLDLWSDPKAATNLTTIFTVAGIVLLLVTAWCWKCKANFGLCVFGLVAFGVLLTGLGNSFGGSGAFFNIGLAVLFLAFTGLSVMIKTQKLLTLIILMTALIFLFSGLTVLVDGDWVGKVQGVFCIINFIACFWLGFGLVSDGKVKYF